MAAMNPEERAALAAKMDADIDDFMDQLIADRKGKPAAEPKEFDYDAWVADVEGHPAFMQGLDGGGPMSETLEALQAMKYDDDDGPDEIADQAKADGNRCFKYAKYRNAVEAYSEGIRAKCPSRPLNAQLYANRAAAHARLENLRSGASDCLAALRFDPTHAKAAIRGMELFLRLKEPKRALDIADKLQNADQAQSAEMGKLADQARLLSKQMERDARKDAHKDKKMLLEKLRLLAALKARDINFSSENAHINFNEPKAFDLRQLEIPFPQLEKPPSVHLVAAPGSGALAALAWPVLLAYPESGQTDFVAAWPEWATLRSQLGEVLATPPPWDSEGRYRLDRVSVFFDSATSADTLVQVRLDETLAEVLAREDLRLSEPMPTLVVMDPQSAFAEQYFQKMKKKT